MPRLWLLVLCGALALCGCGGEPEAPESPAPAPGPIEVPLPPEPPPPPPSEQAIGIYMLETAQLRVALTLEADGTFRFLSARAGQGQRRAEGTWSLAGGVLTLVYTQLDGQPMPSGPEHAEAAWRGTTVELRGAGLDRPVVLVKRTMIRGR